MGYVYGFGASVAIIGALFKILHLPGASIMLIAGLGVEAIIFALSSFEPPHETPDWSLVYPELAGLEPIDKPAKSNGGNGGGDTISGLVSAGAIDQKTIDQLATGVKNLANTTSQMSDLADASVATKSYLNNVKNAADSLNQFSAAQNSVSEAGNKLAAKINEEGNKFGDSFNKLNSAFATQAEQSAKLGSNMTAVTEAYQQQLKGINSQLESTKNMASGLSSISAELAASVEGVKEYRQQIASLSKTVGELNNIYGNMLSAIRR
ncbi:MAG: gliding motility protein GldL [Bacteroidales bacterium]|nr:gliding motility protein GldL [Bacteroidales bacterium]MDD5816564.1 gliding motility protein GldL [Bacteroidales bacterium]MDY4520117.1 gliding motility protein GldL [Bacteroidales bacterium]